MHHIEKMIRTINLVGLFLGSTFSLHAADAKTLHPKISILCEAKGIHFDDRGNELVGQAPIDLFVVVKASKGDFNAPRQWKCWCNSLRTAGATKAENTIHIDELHSRDLDINTLKKYIRETGRSLELKVEERSEIPAARYNWEKSPFVMKTEEDVHALGDMMITLHADGRVTYGTH